MEGFLERLFCQLIEIVFIRKQGHFLSCFSTKIVNNLCLKKTIKLALPKGVIYLCKYRKKMPKMAFFYELKSIIILNERRI